MISDPPQTSAIGHVIATLEDVHNARDAAVNLARRIVGTWTTAADVAGKSPGEPDGVLPFLQLRSNNARYAIMELQDALSRIEAALS